MLSFDYTKDLLNLQGVNVDKIEQFETVTNIHISLPVKAHICPHCQNSTKYVHDYRVRQVKDIPAFGKHVILFFKQRRYRCDKCGKRFSEDNSFVSKYYHMSKRLINDIFIKLESVCSFTEVSKALNISVSSVIRMFDYISYLRPAKPPKVLAIDEFKGNTGKEKYQAILTDPSNGLVLDILPNRTMKDLIEYVKQWNRDERNQVDFFVSDMWKPYEELASTFFKQATQIIDKYHYVRQIIWAFERVRKKIQKKYGKENRLLFKQSKTLLTKRQSKLKPEQAERVAYLLNFNDDLRSAYYLKELFYQVIDTEDRQKAKQLMKEWIMTAQDSRLEDYQKCSLTLERWATGILNTFDYDFSNGFTEGCNNKIKVLKRNAYGYQNFKRFRNRILHIFNYKKQLNMGKAAAY